jgi:hypothetical protein
MVDLHSIIEMPITPEDVLILREMERARRRSHMLRSVPSASEENDSIPGEDVPPVR